MKNQFLFIAAALIITAVSFAFDREKSITGLKKAWRMFRGMAIPFLSILVLVSLLLYLVPPALITRYLGPNSGAAGLAIAALAGSITLIPGFISYPIAAGLVKQGASYTTVATFMTTLMMVGVVTFPLESRYFGRRAALVRNLLNFIAAVLIGLLVGVIL